MPNYSESCKKLISADKSLAMTYLKCIEDYISTIDDIKLVLSSLPPRFSKSTILHLYFLASEAKQNPNNPEIIAALAEIKNYQTNIDQYNTFQPKFNHNFNEIIAQKACAELKIRYTHYLPPNELFLRQYNNARLFSNSIDARAEKYLAPYYKTHQETSKSLKKNEDELKKFSKNTQSAHSVPGEVESMDNLKRSYPDCDIAKNLDKVKNFIEQLDQKEVNLGNKQHAQRILHKINTDHYYAIARERLAYVWEALEQGDKLTGEKARDVPLALLQANRKESLIQHLASAETNYATEGKSYNNSGRSCPEGTKNIILDTLNGYHSDVSFGYNFKDNSMLKLNKDVAPIRFKELFLEQMSKFPMHIREDLIREWNPDESISSQTHLHTKQKVFIEYAMNQAEDLLLKEYPSSHYDWYQNMRESITQESSLDKISLLKPEIDLLYEYKQLLAGKNFSYKEMNETISNGGNLEHLDELMSNLEGRGIPEDIIRDLILSIEQKDLLNLSANILAKEYTSKIEINLKHLPSKYMAEAAIWKTDEYLNEWLSGEEESLASALKEKFKKNIKVTYHPSIYERFYYNKLDREKISAAIFNGTVTNIEDIDFRELKEYHKIHNASLTNEFNKLKAIRPRSYTTSKGMKDISNEQDKVNSTLVESFFNRYTNLIQEGNTSIASSFLKKHSILLTEIISPENEDISILLNLVSQTEGGIALAQHLLDMGADPNIQNKDGQNALHLAVRNYNIRMIKELIKAKADPNIRDNNGHTAKDINQDLQYDEVVINLLKEAVRNQDIQAIDSLLTHHEDLREKYISPGKTIISYASDRNLTKAHKHLIKPYIESIPDRNRPRNPNNSMVSKSLNSLPKQPRENTENIIKNLRDSESIKKNIPKKSWNPTNKTLPDENLSRNYNYTVSKSLTSLPKKSKAEAENIAENLRNIEVTEQTPTKRRASGGENLLKSSQRKALTPIR